MRQMTGVAAASGNRQYLLNVNRHHVRLVTPHVVEFISIKSSAATESDAPGNYAAHSRVPSRDHGPLLSQADAVLHDATALDTAIDMLDPQPTLVQGLVRELLLPRQLLAAGFLGRHEDLHLRECECQ